jgi:iron uptake system component EfeO
MIQSGFDTLSTLYMADQGDALPAVPSDWSSDDPSQADLQSPFGMLWESVHQAVDPTTTGSVVFEMNMAATMLGFPQFVEQ